MKQQNVRKGEELNVVLLKKFMQEQQLINSVESDLHVEQFTHGFSNLTYLLRIENKEYVLRKPPIGAIKRGHDMGREFKVQSGLETAYPKVPKMHAFSEDATILGSAAKVKLTGTILKTSVIQKSKTTNLMKQLKVISGTTDAIGTRPTDTTISFGRADAFNMVAVFD